MATRKIEILGTGCAKCAALKRSAREAVAKLGLDAEILEVDRIEDIVRRGVMLTPALAVDGVVKSSGKVLSAEDVGRLLV